MRKAKISVYDIVVIGMMVAALENAEAGALFSAEYRTGNASDHPVYIDSREKNLLCGFCLRGAGGAAVRLRHLVGNVSLYVAASGVGHMASAPQKRRLDVCPLSGAFGLGFGAMCAVPYLFVGGINTAFAWWVSGIPFDIIHGISNFVLMLILYKPLRKVLEHGWRRTGSIKKINAINCMPDLKERDMILMP